MSNKIISTKEEVLLFITDLKNILLHSCFNIETDFSILLRKRNESPLDPYTTENTLISLGYTNKDIVKQLLSLKLSEYIETVIDNLDNSRPPFFVFAKVINDKDVYIKIKIRSVESLKVFCVSFHYARYPFPSSLPYE